MVKKENEIWETKFLSIRQNRNTVLMETEQAWRIRGDKIKYPDGTGSEGEESWNMRLEEGKNAAGFWLLAGN